MRTTYGQDYPAPAQEVASNTSDQPLATYVAPPEQPDGAMLENAGQLSLALVPASPEATALLDAVFRRVLAEDARHRRRQRGAGQQEALRRAVGALVAGVLWRWPRAAFRSVAAQSFTGTAVSYRAFAAARDALVRLGLLGHAPGVRFRWGEDFDGGAMWAGRASRFWSAAELLRLAEAHGVSSAGAARAAFRLEVPKAPPRVRAPVELRAFKRQRGRQTVKGELLALDPTADAVRLARDSVEAHNAFAAGVEVTGCAPPRWRRTYTTDFRLGGRWWAVGAEAYQTMRKTDRRNEIRIGGERVVEVDVCSAHLSILHGVFGLPLPVGDLYGVVPDVPRHIVKAWTTVTLGRGRAVPRWGQDATVEQTRHDAAAICAAMVAAYPFLADLRAVVPGDLRVEHGDRRELVSLYLQGVEAAALTGALEYVRAHGHLALPLHDGLLVAASAERFAWEGLEGAFEVIAGVRPRLEASPRPGQSGVGGSAW